MHAAFALFQAQRRSNMGRTIGISVGGLILLLIIVAVLF
jgi:hypothetical protein